METEIRYANINIIEGIGASQYGIGVVSARLAEAVLREQAVFTVAAYHPEYEVTLSLLSVLSVLSMLGAPACRRCITRG